jgi:hypothetical protein
MLFILLLVLVICLCVYTLDSSGNSGIDKFNIKKLIRQTARWASAADQDTNGYIANLHATYAMGYLMALREIYTDEEIEKYTGINVKRFEFEINNIMNNAVKQLSRICPEGRPKNVYLATLSNEGYY